MDRLVSCEYFETRDMTDTDFQNDLLGLVRDELTKRRGDRREICASTGVGYSTLCKIATGLNENPRFNTLQALASYFREHPRVPAATEPFSHAG